MLKIALAGASGTGKSQLAVALSEALKASEQEAVVLVANIAAFQADCARYDLTLLMGLEIGVEQTGESTLTETSSLMREADDHSIRNALTNAGVPYQVIYGSHEERLSQAIDAIGGLLRRAKNPRQISTRGGGKNSAWAWICDKCGDPQCEHLLLTALLTRRSGSG
ncbi:MAG: hypothetical protein HHJ16_09960 [Polaromonas sp.]|uniref:hypothetical protein n=1 Tax=Polaromonas sp. TaxID=1869339 RepID=UPI001806531C|nr:hypothetical protein [Polaromonas sp.]NMM10585.1 hypothetical protein [Polaromonas sp.]